MSLFFFFFLCCLRAIQRVTQIHGLTGLAWQCTRKVIRAATVSNPCEYKTFPILVRLDGERWIPQLCGSVWRYQKHALDAFLYTQVFIICSLFVCMCQIKGDLLLCVCVRVAACVYCRWQSWCFCTQPTACVCVLYEPISKVIKSVEMLYTICRVSNTVFNGKITQLYTVTDYESESS